MINKVLEWSWRFLPVYYVGVVKRQVPVSALFAVMLSFI